MLTATRTYAGEGLVPSRDPNDARVDSAKLAPGTYAKGQAVGLYNAGAAQNEIQTATVNGTPTGGTFRLALNGRPTAALNHNASAAVVQAALEALPNVGAGNVGVALASTVYTITYQGALANQDIPLLTLFANNLTGGSSPTVALAATQIGRAAGAYWGAYNDALSNGLQAARGLVRYPTEVGLNGIHAMNHSIFGEVSEGKLSAPVYIAGTFALADLVGLDANGVVDLGRLINGTAITDPGVELRIG
jgi:hypothetical protein